MPLSRSPHPGLARSLPFMLFMALLVLRAQMDGDGLREAGIGDSRWWYALQAGAAATFLVAFWHLYGELHDWHALWRRQRRAVGLALLAGLAIGAVWVLPDRPWMRQGGSDVAFVPLDAQGQVAWALVAARAAGAVLVVPLMEELFWRSFLMRWIDQRNFLDLAPAQVSTRAWIWSSAVFALAHDQWLVAFGAGLVFGAIYRRSGQIWLAVLAHAMANAALAVYVVSQGAWSYW